MIEFCGSQVPFGMNILFEADSMPEFKFAVEICEDLWVAAPPSIGHAAAGALVIANLSASDETTGKDSYRQRLVAGSRRGWLAVIFMPMPVKANRQRI